MADDGVIRIGTEVDISGIKSGMAEAAQSVKASTSEMSAAYEQLASTTAEYSVTSANLRAVIRQLVDGQVPYTLAVKALTPALMEQSTAAKALAAAKAELAQKEKDAAIELQAQNELLVSNALAQTAAATAANELAVSQSEVAATARLAGREMGGFVGAQLGMLAARSETLAPILSSPFLTIGPIVAGVGLILYQFGQKIYEIRKQAEEAAQSIEISFRKMSDSIRASNDALLTEGDRLQGELDKLMGRPAQNGMLIAFDEASAAADKLSVSIDRDIDKMRQLTDENNKKNSIGFWGSLFTGKAETGDTQKMIQRQLKNIQAVNDEYGTVVQHAADSGDKANLAQAQESQLVALQDAYKKATDSIEQSLAKASRAQDAYEESGKVFGKDQTANINLLRGALQQLAEEQRNIGEQYRNEVLQQQVTPAQEAKSSTSAGNSAARQRLQQIEASLDALAQKEAALTGHGLTAGEGMAFWEQYLTTFKAGSEQAKHVMEQYVRAQEQFHKQLQTIVKAEKKSDDQNIHMEGLGTGLNKWIASQYDNVLQTGQAWKQYHSELEKASDIQSTAAANIRIAQVRAAEASGAITKLGADQKIAAIHAEEYRAKLAALNGELQRLKNEAAANTAAGVSNSKNAAQQQQITNQIAQVQGQAQVSGISDQSAISQQIANPYIQAFDQIDSRWLELQNNMLYSTRFLGQQFARMGQELLVSIVDNMEKAALVYAEKELMMLLVHQQTTAAKTAITAQGAAASQAITSVSAMKEIGSAAATAAAKAWKALAGIPVVGPELGAVAAAATFAGVLAFRSMAAFEAGTGYVPRDGVAMLHEGEAVIPAPTMSELRGTSGGGDLHIHNVNNVNAPTEKAILRALDRNPGAIAGALQRHLRQAGRG
ncbi:MAG: hypothetical protein ACLGSD_13860 [Acidobacteriota bacterium]